MRLDKQLQRDVASGPLAVQDEQEARGIALSNAASMAQEATHRRKSASLQKKTDSSQSTQGHLRGLSPVRPVVFGFGSHERSNLCNEEDEVLDCVVNHEAWKR